jgi:hypothetical protein
MASTEEYSRIPVEARLQRLACTPDELAGTTQGETDVALSTRPGPQAWSAKEVICHLRDIEELVITRFHLMLVMEDPRVFVAGAPPCDPENWGIDEQVPFPFDPVRWAEERQYQRCDAILAIEAFRRRRREVLTLLRRLSPVQWHRGCIMPDRTRITYEGWTAGMANHDDEHLAQLRRALGKPGKTER